MAEYAETRAESNALTRFTRVNASRRGGVSGLLVTVVVLFAIATFAWVQGNIFLVDNLTLVLVYACAGVAWNVAGGFSGLLSFGHAAFYGLGAYALAEWMNRLHGSPWTGLLVGGITGGVLACLTLLATFRLKGHYFIMATVALGEIVYVVFLNWSGVGASSGVSVALRPIGLANLSFGLYRVGYTYLALVLLGLFLVVSLFVGRSRFGYLVFGTRDDDVAAASLGVRTFLVQLGMFSLSGVLAGVAGAYYAVYTLFVSPDTVLSLDVSTQIALVAVIGGLGWAYGSVFGAAITVVISSYANAAFGQYGSGLGGLVYALLIILIALFEPRGLYALVARLSQWASPATDWIRRIDIAARLRPRNRVRPAQELDEDSAFVAGNGGFRLRQMSQEVATPSDERVLAVDSVSKRFGGLRAVDRVSFDVRDGEVVAVVGANGAGKTTLFNCMSGHYVPDGGVVLLAGVNVAAKPAHRVARAGLARTFQLMRNFPSLTVRENCLVAALALRGGMRRARAETEACLSWAGLLPQADMLSSELTTADRKRLEVCRALLIHPRVLLLDEVMSGLNPTETAAAIRLLRQIRDSGISVVLVEHVMEVVSQVAERVVVLDAGAKLAEGTPQEVLRMPAVVEAYLGAGHGAEST